MFGTIVGRFYLRQDLGLEDDDTPDTVTVSELIETYPLWGEWVKQLQYGKKQLFTMFETSDVHPDIIEAMKVFDKVIVPFDYLKNILVKHGVTCEVLNWYTSPLIRSKPRVIHKQRDQSRLVFLFVGTNDVRKNTLTLTHMFDTLLKGTNHMLIVKTNNSHDLPISKNIKYITHRATLPEIAGLYNICDYVVSFTRGEGVGLPMLEAKYFGKPVIAHTGGVLSTIKNDSWIELPCEEVDIDYTHVPQFLKKVFYGTWWQIDEHKTLGVLRDIIR
jgi:glycosyltransferase involved in cell wall biosynthesis